MHQAARTRAFEGSGAVVPNLLENESRAVVGVLSLLEALVLVADQAGELLHDSARGSQIRERGAPGVACGKAGRVHHVSQRKLLYNAMMESSLALRR